MAKYYDDARTRIKSKLKQFNNIIAQAKARNVNEADTRDIVKAMMGELLGLDPFFEVTGEFSVKGQFADFAVKVEERILYFVEVKSVDTKLDEKHLYQVIGYAANHGVEWAVLTNADEWRVYRLFAGDSKKTEQVLHIVMSQDPPLDVAEKFLIFSKEGFRQRSLESHWENLQALHPLRICEMILSEPIVTVLRKEITKAGKIKVEPDTVRAIVLNQIFRGDLADSIKAAPQPKKPQSVPNKKAVVVDSTTVD